MSLVHGFSSAPKEAEGGLTNADETLMTSQSDKNLRKVSGRTQEHVFSRRAAAASLPSNVIPVQLRLLLLLFSTVRKHSPPAFKRGKRDLHFAMFHEPEGCRESLRAKRTLSRAS